MTLSKGKIKIFKPKPLDVVGGKILILGKISKSLLFTSSGVDTTIFLDVVGIDGVNWRSGSDFNVKFGLLSKFKKNIWFSTSFSLYKNDIAWIKKSYGLLNLKFHTREYGDILYIPIIVKGFEPLKKISDKIIEKHKRMGEIIKQYQIDLQEWEKEMENIRLNNANKINVTETDDLMTIIDIEDDDLLKKLLRIISSSNSEYEELYKIAKQAQAEKKLADKYKEAIEWRGPLFRGAVERWRGFIFKVHSDDHGKHFHAMHGEKGIDARISFPEIEIIDYKLDRKKISTKEEKAIKELFKDPLLFEKLKKEFNKKEDR